MNKPKLKTVRERARQRLLLERRVFAERNIRRWERKLELLDYPEPTPIVAALQYTYTGHDQVRADTLRLLLETTPDLLPFTRSKAGSLALSRYLDRKWKIGDLSMALIARSNLTGDYKRALLEASGKERKSTPVVIYYLREDLPNYPIAGPDGHTIKVVDRQAGDIDIDRAMAMIRNSSAQGLGEISFEDLADMKQDKDLLLALSENLRAENLARQFTGPQRPSIGKRADWLRLIVDNPEFFRDAPAGSNGRRIWEMVNQTLLDNAEENREVILKVWADRSPFRGDTDLMSDFSDGAELSAQDLVRKLFDDRKA